MVFRRFAHVRPHWGLNWLCLSYALAALLNLCAGPVMAQPQLSVAQLLNTVVGISCMGLLCGGVRLYLGVQRPRPWATFGVVWLLYGVLIALRLIWPHWLLTLAGAGLAALMFTYLAWLGLQAARREPGAGHNVAATMLMLYLPLVVLAAQAGLDAHTLAYWGAVPYTLAGLGLMAATMGRLNVELQDLNAHLEQRVAARTQQLQEVINDLESFNSMVSHDLRGPLGGVQGISQIAADAIEKGEQDRALRMVRAIHTASSSLTTLVSDLLTLAKSSHVDVQKQAAPLQQIVTEALQWLEISKGDGATRPVQCSHLDLTIDADPALMRQVMVNLIGNALKYSSQSPAPQVQVSARQVDQGCELTVADNGVGFDPAQADQLFKPFRRLDQRGQFEGFGVGLTIVHRIVSGHGGRVWAEAQPGQGARFHVWLPVG